MDNEQMSLIVKTICLLYFKYRKTNNIDKRVRKVEKDIAEIRREIEKKAS